MHEWLVALSDTEMAALSGTKDLERHISCIVRWYTRRQERGEEVQYELADFLARVNARVRASRQ